MAQDLSHFPVENEEIIKRKNLQCALALRSSPCALKFSVWPEMTPNSSCHGDPPHGTFFFLPSLLDSSSQTLFLCKCKFSTHLQPSVRQTLETQLVHLKNTARVMPKFPESCSLYSHSMRFSPGHSEYSNSCSQDSPHDDSQWHDSHWYTLKYITDDSCNENIQTDAKTDFTNPIYTMPAYTLFQDG